jgi:uncharacterized protein YndB with AHSA1/START domain
MSASEAGMDFTVMMLVDRTPDEVFAAINDVRGWWSGEIEGETDRPGAQFTYRYADVHRSVQRITEMVPGRKVVWRVVDSHRDYLVDKSEWTGTDIIFEVADRQGQTEVRFTHRGLNDHSECYGSCSNAWGALLNRNLRGLIATGEPQPDALA